MKRKPTIALALGGGGARGIAHLGVIQAFEEVGIRPDLIVGSSAGALVGAAYAATADLCATLRRVEEIFGSGQPGVNGFRKFIRFQNSDAPPRHLLDGILRSWAKEIVVGCVMFRKAVMSEKDLRECIAAFVPEIDIEQTQIPLVVSAVDLISGQAAALRSGPLVEAVMASCAVPGFTPPVDWDGHDIDRRCSCQRHSGRHGQSRGSGSGRGRGCGHVSLPPAAA
ncbi:MAG: patatin-like phospholipase family protein [Deltaproteobacteria bacterium]|nr:patatin-like phospholipase family protein [Deltaproteobacteria bacterium]